MRYGHDAYIFGKIWYAIKVLKSEYGYSDRDTTWENRNSYLFYWRIGNDGSIKADVQILQTKYQWLRARVNRDALEIIYGAYDEKLDFEILHCDEHFLKLMDKDRTLYYFVSDSKNYKQP